jgi:uncharacterized membrane protein
MKLIDMEMQNVKFISETTYPVEHQHVIGGWVAHIAVETQSGGRTANELGSGDRIRGRKQRHIVTQANQFIREIGNNSLGSTIKSRRHALHKRRDLRNFHVLHPRAPASAITSREAKQRLSKIAHTADRPKVLTGAAIKGLANLLLPTGIGISSRCEGTRVYISHLGLESIVNHSSFRARPENSASRSSLLHLRTSGWVVVEFGGAVMIKKKTKKKTNLEISAKNIETIVRLEEEDEQQISHADWISDSIGGFAGTTYFVVLQLAFIIAWLIVNLGLISSAPVFDPCPFPLLSATLSAEGVFLLSFVLITQNRAYRRLERRTHLDLQINLLSEKELTKALQLLGGISRRLGVDVKTTDSEAAELSKDTSIEDLARNLRATE